MGRVWDQRDKSNIIITTTFKYILAKMAPQVVAECEMCGMKTFSNQVENVLISNQPFFDTEYTVPMKTMKSKFL